MHKGKSLCVNAQFVIIRREFGFLFWEIASQDSAHVVISGAVL
jgi:hypothetical protein